MSIVECGEHKRGSMWLGTCFALAISICAGNTVHAALKDVISIRQHVETFYREPLAKDLLNYHQQGRLAPELEVLIKLLLDTASDPNVCERRTLQYLRQRYAAVEGSRPLWQSVRLRSEHDIGISGLADALFWLKGRTSGLYEYYDLTGDSALRLPQNPVVDLTTDPDKWRALLEYQLFVLLSDLGNDVPSGFFQPGKGPSVGNAYIQAQLIDYFGADDNLVRRFLVDYPFLPGSHLRYLAEHDFPAWRNMPVLRDELLVYYNTFLRYNADRLLFLKKMHRAFGEEHFRKVVGRLMDSDADAPSVDQTFLLDLLRLSAEVHMWDLVAKAKTQLQASDLPEDVVAIIQTARSDLQAQIELLDALLDSK